jgi:hypothetical protein
LLAQVNASRMLLALRRENDRIFFGKQVDVSAEWVETVLGRFEQLLFVKTPQHAVMRGPAFYQIAGVQPNPEHEWTDTLAPESWAALSPPVQESDGPAKRWSRDFELHLKLPQGPQTLKGQVIHCQVHGQHTELWVLGPQ